MPDRKSIITNTLVIIAGTTSLAFGAPVSPQAYQAANQDAMKQHMMEQHMGAEQHHGWSSGYRFHYKRGDDEITIQCPPTTSAQDCVSAANSLIGAMAKNATDQGSANQQPTTDNDQSDQSGQEQATPTPPTPAQPPSQAQPSQSQ